VIDSHYAFADLCRYLERESDDVNDAELECHLAACPGCHCLSDDARMTLQILRDPAMWPTASEAICERTIGSDADAGELEELLRFADRLATEKLDAADQFRSSLLAGTGESAETLTVPMSNKPTAGAVTYLLEEARLVRATIPRRALALVNLAVELAKALPSAAYPARQTFLVRGQAYRDRGAILVSLGLESEAREALGRADAALRQTPAAELELTLVDQVRATMLMSAGRSVEALLLIRRAVRIFGKFLDFTNYARARTMEAALLGYSVETTVANATVLNGVAVPELSE